MKKELRSKSKSDTMMRLSQAVFSLEVSRGHLQWKVTDLVRKADLSRPLVYRYFGSSKNEILFSALRIFTNEFYCFSGTPNETKLSQRIQKAREYVHLNPEAIVFYQIWRTRESIFQKEFLSIEKKFQKGLKKLFNHYSDQQILAAHACIHGIVTSPFMTPDLVSGVCAELERANVLA